MAEEMRSADIQQAVELAAKTYGAVGVQATVIRGGVTGETYVYGWATKDTDPMTPNHKFRTASITKIATGIAAMLLREQDVLRLGDPVANYWGDQVQNPNHPSIPITIQNCLTHTSSISTFLAGTSLSYVDMADQLRKPESYTMAVPGEPATWDYNNYVFALLGLAFERATNLHLDVILNPASCGTPETLSRFTARMAGWDSLCPPRSPAAVPNSRGWTVPTIWAD